MQLDNVGFFIRTIDYLKAQALEIILTYKDLKRAAVLYQYSAKNLKSDKERTESVLSDFKNDQT